MFLLGPCAQFTKLGERGYAVGGSIRQRLNCHRGLTTSGCHETAAVAQEQILYVMRTMISIDHRAFRIVPHAAGSQQLNGELLLGDRKCPLLLRTGSIEKFQRSLVQPS